MPESPHHWAVVGKPEVIDGPRGQVLVSRITGHLKLYFICPVNAFYRDLTIKMWTCATLNEVAKFVRGEQEKNARQKLYQYK